MAVQKLIWKFIKTSMAMSVPAIVAPMALLEEGDCFTDDGWGGLSHQPSPSHSHRHFGSTITKDITELTKHLDLLSSCL